MSAEFFAEAIAGSWKRAKTEGDWFQIRSWCHGAAIYAERGEDRIALRLLKEIAIQHQEEAA